MSIAVEMQHGIIALAGERRPSDTRESMIARAARQAGISYRQAKAFFYAETSNPRGNAIEAVREAIARREQQTEKAASDELADLRTRIARLERLLEASGSHGHRPLDHQVRTMDGWPG